MHTYENPAAETSTQRAASSDAKSRSVPPSSSSSSSRRRRPPRESDAMANFNPAAHRVAALGNVATRPDLRGRGLARIAVAATCQALRPHVDHLGLNVDAANAEGIRLYEGLGFVRVATYEEVRVG